MIPLRASAYAARMTLIHRLLPLAVASLLPASLHAAGAELEAEYSQVRKIAMKDAGVRAAYAKADAKLNAKMIEIDPSLRPLVEKGGPAPAPRAPVSRATAKQPAPKAAASQSQYIVAKGDTLTSIAARHRVTVADLKSANAIADEHKLQVGQKLTIPTHSPTTKSAAKRDAGFWKRLGM